MDAVVVPAFGVGAARARVIGACFVVLGAAILIARPFDPAYLPMALACLLIMAVVVAEDIEKRRARNALVVPGTAAVITLALVSGWDSGWSALAGAAAAFAILLLIALVGGGRMGMGDVKFGALCGAGAGFGGLFVLLASAFVLGGALAAILLLAGIRGRHDTTAFTPYLALGVLAAWLLNAGPA